MDSLERFRQLAEWLAETDIAVLELRGPDTSIRLDRGPGATRDPRGHDDPGLHPGYGHAPATVRSP